MNEIKSGSLNKRTENSKSRNQYFYLKLLIGFTVILVLTSLFPSQILFEVTDLKIGSISDKEIIAPFDFPVLFTTEELKQKKKKAQDKVIPVFNYDTNTTQKRLKESAYFFRILNRFYESKSKTDSTLIKIIKSWPQNINETILLVIKSDLKKKRLLQAQESIHSLIKSYYKIGVIKSKKHLEINKHKIIHLKKDQTTKLQISINDLVDLNYCRQKAVTYLRTSYHKHPEMIKVWKDIYQVLLQSNVSFNPEETELLKNNAAAQVPISKGIIYEGEKIIDAHKRISKEDANILKSLAHTKRALELKESVWGILTSYIGRIFSSFIILSIFIVYLIKFRQNIYKEVNLLFLLAIILIGITTTAYISASMEQVSKFFIPIAIGSILVTILFDTETAFLFTVLTSFHIGNIHGFDYKLTLITLIVGFIAILSVQKVRHRKEFYKAMLFIPLAYCVGIFMIGFLSFTPLHEILSNCGLGAITGITSTLLSIGILPICETLFKISTDITLLELSDLNHPLLRKMSIESPGTYQHSMMVSHLSEAAAETIGAHSLLARVGSYYHDLGKMNKSEYFVENQKDVTKSKHNALTPSMSKTIILAHTKNGIEMANKNKLPQCIIDFIPQHQGTTLIQYFYQKALENKSDIEVISENDFRYPGPKPQSKETAIVMIADSVEAASRTIKNPKTSSLRILVDKIIENKYKDNQFDECDLTFKELTHIRESFVRVLTGIYHSRIPYPEQGKKEQPPKISPPVKTAFN